MTSDEQSETASIALPSGPRTVPGRECGSCMLCCKVMAIADIDKPAGVWCPNCKRGVGCVIYDTRPGECRRFYCRWMLDQGIPDDWKPERTKFALVVYAGGHITAYPDPGFPAAWRKSPYLEQ